MNFASAHMFSSSRELRKPPDDFNGGLTLAQVGLGQSRGYLTVREGPDSSGQKKWCVLREDKLWLFDSHETSKLGSYIPLEKAIISDGVTSRTRSSDVDRSMVTEQLTAFEVQTSKGRVYSLQAKSSGDANMWIRACRQHTAKETENQIMDKAELMIAEAEKRSTAFILDHVRRLRQEREQSRLVELSQRRK